ncbi:protein tyrosine phosphatase family protein, ptpla protein, partial [Toxoplasma gondii TgCatPRC2]
MAEAAPARASLAGKVPGPRPPSLAVHLYLFLYNCVATAAWSVVFFLFAQHVCQRASWTDFAVPALYRSLEFPLLFAQSMQVMEVLHAAAGIVRSGVMTTLTQVFSRLQLVLFLFRVVPVTHENAAFCSLIAAWCLAELLRYPFFCAQELLLCIHHKEAKKAFGDDAATAIVKSKTEAPMILRWLRYSGEASSPFPLLFFTILFPLSSLLALLLPPCFWCSFSLLAPRSSLLLSVVSVRSSLLLSVFSVRSS